MTLGVSNTMDIGPANQIVLQADLSQYLDTVHDKLRKDTKKQGLRKLTNRITIIPVAWHNSFELRQLPHAIQWHPSLPEPGASSIPLRDVYLVSIPHMTWPTSLKHWSLYSQGTFFHLVLRGGRPDLQIDTLTKEQLSSELDCIKEQVRCDNVHRLNAFNAPNRHVPMVAYHVGQTQFNLAQMNCLARFIFERYDRYTKHEMNCHLFALSLGTRVLMTQGLGTIFVGTRAQIVHWDTVAISGEHSFPYRQEDGYLLRAPSRDLSNRSTRHVFNLKAVFADLRHESHARAIRNLYLHGPSSIRSFDPHGRYSSRSSYLFASTSESLSEYAKGLTEALKEFAQDLRHGEVAEAFRGRRTSNLRAYEEVFITARKGDRISQILLPFHKRILSISDDDAREVWVRVINREKALEGGGNAVSNSCCTCASDEKESPSLWAGMTAESSERN